jgi:hypothetical protein
VQEPRELHHTDAEVLPGLTGESPASIRRQVGEGDRQVGLGDAATPRQGCPSEIPEAPANRERERRRQPGQSRRQPTNERYAEPRRRSRISSMKIGTSDSRITIPTTMWMWSPILGIACPRRYPAHVMLVTHPIPPATL